MQYRVLGRTGLNVSEISLGTVQMGMPYGIPKATGNLPQVEEAEALEILRRGFIEGVNFLDTARGYGDSEAVIGRALKRRSEDIIIATKLEGLDERMNDEELAKGIRDSIELSRRTLDRETLDIIQLHNATEGLLNREVILDILSQARHRERIRFQGVTTYGLGAPEKAIEQGYWDTVQVEFNLFNQRARSLFEEAASRNIGLIIRSAMLKGAMTTEEQDMPDALKVLRQKAMQLPDYFQRRQLTVAQVALLFVLSHPQVGTVLSGVLNVGQLLENLAVSGEPVFAEEQLTEAQALQIPDEQLTDPRQWDAQVKASP